MFFSPPLLSTHSSRRKSRHILIASCLLSGTPNLGTDLGTATESKPAVKLTLGTENPPPLFRQDKLTYEDRFVDDDLDGPDRAPGSPRFVAFLKVQAPPLRVQRRMSFPLEFESTRLPNQLEDKGVPPPPVSPPTSPPSVFFLNSHGPFFILCLHISTDRARQGDRHDNR